MARITLTQNFKFRDLLAFDNPQGMMREVGVRLAVKIENRTLRGQDENGKPFARYSRDYQRRVKRGRSTVDLHGEPQPRMFADFAVTKATKTTMELGFTSAFSALKALWHDVGAGHLPVRQFLGVPEQWIPEIKAFIISRMRR